MLRHCVLVCVSVLRTVCSSFFQGFLGDSNSWILCCLYVVPETGSRQGLHRVFKPYVSHIGVREAYEFLRGIRSEEDDLGLVWVKLQKILIHPGLYLS